METLGGDGIGNPSQRLSIEYRRVETLTPNPNNPRIHTDRQVRKIARSIEVFGFVIPVVIGPSGQVVAGHGRVQAARLLRLNEIPTLSLQHLSENQLAALMLADNRLCEQSTWDPKLLGRQLKVLSEVELNFSLEATGFELGEIDLLIGDLQPGPRDDRIADAVPGAEPGIRVTVPGDLWLLGGSRVLCADSLDARSYSRIMEGQKARMVLNDPPYLAPNSAEEELIDFYTRIFNLLISQSVEGSIHFVFADWRQMTEVLIAGKHVYGKLNDLCIGVKDKAEAGSLYRSQHELVFVFKAGKDCQETDFQAKRPGSERSNVWRYPRSKSRSQATDSGSLTTKPVSVVANAIVDCSSTGDVVLDPFLGSGTTVIAAEQTGRICYGIEIDAHVVDTIVRRWQTFTGLTAKHASSGRTFRECEQEVGREFKR